MLYSPALLVLVLLETPVSVLVTTTSAPGIAAPVWSVTEPDIEAEAICAETGVAASNIKARLKDPSRQNRQATLGVMFMVLSLES